MTSVTTKPDFPQPQSDAVHLFDDWFDPIEAGVRDRVRDFIHAMIEAKLCMKGPKDDPNMQRPTRIGWSHSKAVAVVGFVMRIHFERVLA